MFPYRGNIELIESEFDNERGSFAFGARFPNPEGILKNGQTGKIQMKVPLTLAVPVSLIGTFVLMQVFGITINLITLFALVLAIGFVVDDAIVVVEAVHAKMEAEHLSLLKTTKKAIREIAGAIIAITFFMVSVFILVAFMSCSVGVFYR
ncbi:efflux RND transporter permease subunit [Sphingobacterium sp. xlx-130]|uniref:efflux RND transporter permease subunit n=1 Tax=Sphingobacterium sp. xlx-130 TaxID=2654323 RepID=UPI0039790FDA